MTRRVLVVCVRVLVCLCVAGAAGAQPPAAIERVTFDDAVRRALENNPNVVEAAQAILRADTLLQQARTVYRPTVSGSVTTTVLDAARGFDEFVTQPRTQSLLGASVSYPVLAAARWAQQAQADDQIRVARLGVDETRRQIALAAAQAYLAVIAQQRQVEVNERARENAIAHVDYAGARLQGGMGSRLNALRASQELATDEVFLESARLALRRSQEALGVLVASDAPVDAAAEPALEIATRPADDAWLGARADIQLFSAQIDAADRVVRDSWRDWVPTATASFEPQLLTPAGLFAPSRSWRGFVQVSVPVFDGGARRIARRQREIALETARIQLTDVELRARSELRAAEAAIESTERALQHARLAAQHAAEVLEITDVAFRAGATTNIELIDAQRRTRDADTAAAQAEDRVRQARLDLLVALGRFPQ
ncbi:MAG TPA: TolC family protein [Vicinamibacterales bacterium]|nr:TolC family protein [Vicinamibacterales bacterium]